VWNIDWTEEYKDWFKTLDEESKEAVFERVLLLKEYGPLLGRPYADVLHGSKCMNLKELRAHAGNHILRVAFCFDTVRNAVLLIGGDKKGKKEKLFYKKLIADAEKLIEKYKFRI